jgi:hypothetical protein
MVNKELLAPKEITRAELKALVDEWVADGGKIKQIPPGVALNFRSAEAENNPAQTKRRFPKPVTAKKAGKVKDKSKKKWK